ncbi:MAG: hypothetical protein CBB87_03545 [Micavibrio sp. TMED27]|nr:flagellar biosynthesis protein FlgJ [Micavibrio sp.]OUT91904.1 MAG: hypothetical protein CBB87_03545 [Micavibrio sp. TMED27]|tara:strand:+ start:2540 stop:2899 length:360 start_codon:yes stop_codon:yes gene_type:complete
MNALNTQQNIALLNVQQGLSEQSKLDLTHAARNKELEKTAEAAKEFEAVFIAEMMKPMFEDIKTDGMFGGGHGEEAFRGVLLQEYGKMVSQTGQLGIADQVKAEMIRMQAQLETTNSAQ